MSKLRTGVGLALGMAVLVTGVGVYLTEVRSSADTEVAPAEAPSPRPDPLPEGEEGRAEETPEAGDTPSQVLEREGVRVGFSLMPLNGGTEVLPGAPAKATFTV